jgi:hypothetical protein
MYQKIGDLKILIRTLQTILCVGSLPDFKAVVFTSGSVFSRAWRCEFGRRRAVLG